MFVSEYFLLSCINYGREGSGPISNEAKSPVFPKRNHPKYGPVAGGFSSLFQKLHVEELICLGLPILTSDKTHVLSFVGVLISSRHVGFGTTVCCRR